ncbi:MFS transporter [Providencia manganoxydans]|uniref:MFS transporter n=1 Tax=Providencia manganoxydans TaxID=2923283 RepID=UPI0034DCFB77
MIETSTIKYSWWPVIAASLATFAVVTTEMLPIGLLNPIVEQFSVSFSSVSLLMTIPAMVAAISSPLVVLFTGRFDRKTVLLFGAMLLVMCNFVTAVTPYFWLLLLSRFFVGICIGIIWANAGGLAPRLVAVKHIGFATSLIFGGVAAASVIGIPLGVLIGEWLGWRGVFMAMGGFSLLLLFFMAYSLPSLPSLQIPTISLFIKQIKRPVITIGLSITLLIVAAHFMAFTYIRPLLTVEGQINGQQLSGILLIYGLAGIAGNFVLGLCASRWLTSTIITIILGICASLTIFILLPINSITGSITMLLWGFMYGGVSVVLMTWMIIHSHKYIEITSSLYIAFFNLGIAAGSTLGGFTVALSDFYTNLSIALLLLLATLILLLSYRKD